MLIQINIFSIKKNIMKTIILINNFIYYILNEYYLSCIYEYDVK